MTAIKPAQAEKFVASPPDDIRLFLLYGGDAGGITERARRLERMALKRGDGDLVTRFGSDELSERPGCIADEAYSASLFGGEPVISLRVLDGRHNVIGALKPLLERPPDASWLIVEGGDLQKTSPLRKAFESSRRAAAIPTDPAKPEDIKSLIGVAANEAGVQIESDALALLSDILAGDRLAARGELEKLFAYVGEEKRATRADVVAIVGNVTEAAAGEVIDAALSGDSERLELNLNRMRAEGEKFAGLGAIAIRHLIALQSYRESSDRGGGGFSGSRFFSETMDKQARRWSLAVLQEARRRMADAVFRTRKTSALEDAAISQALHEIALEGRRLAVPPMGRNT
jgi:DNA polymerase-3 subunit delta